jgi:poly(A) polymerase
MDVVDRVAARLKLSNRLREGLTARICVEQPTPDNIRSIAYRLGTDCACDLAMLYAADDAIGNCLERLDGWKVPEFALGGGELIAMGLQAGPIVAKTLKAIEARWVSENFPEAERLAEIARQSVDEALSASRKA